MSESEHTAAEDLERDEMGRFVVEPTAAPEPEPEATAAPEPEPEQKPAPVVSEPKPAKKKAAPSQAASKLSGDLAMRALVFESSKKNSASVKLLQDRLAEMGHGEARRDKPGWLSVGTSQALRCFQGEAGLEETGAADRETVEALVKGTKIKVSD